MGQYGEINHEICPCVGSNQRPSDQKSSTLPLNYCASRGRREVQANWSNIVRISFALIIFLGNTRLFYFQIILLIYYTCFSLRILLYSRSWRGMTSQYARYFDTAPMRCVWSTVSYEIFRHTKGLMKRNVWDEVA